jgi:hypothetical protein
MGRTDQTHLAPDGRVVDLLHHDWLLLVVLTIAALAIYVVASGKTRAGQGSAGKER